MYYVGVDKFHTLIIDSVILRSFFTFIDRLDVFLILMRPNPLFLVCFSYWPDDHCEDIISKFSKVNAVDPLFR